MVCGVVVVPLQDRYWGGFQSWVMNVVKKKMTEIVFHLTLHMYKIK